VFEVIYSHHPAVIIFFLHQETNLSFSDSGLLNLNIPINEQLEIQ